MLVWQQRWVCLVATERREPEGWDSLVQAALAREERSAEAQAQALLLFLRGKNLSGVGFVHQDDMEDVKEPFISGAMVVSGHRFIDDMYEAAQKRRASGKQCMVRLIAAPASPEGPRVAGSAPHRASRAFDRPP